MRRHRDSTARRATGQRPALVLACGLALFAGARAAVPQPAWVPLGLDLPLPRAYQIAFDPRLPNVAYAVFGSGGVWRSMDGGRFWGPANQGLPDGVSVLKLAVSPAGPLFALVQAGDPIVLGALFASADGAESWHPVNIPAWIANMCAARCGEPAASLAFDAKDPETLYLAGTGGLFRTRDHGASWVRLTSGLGEDAVSVAVDPLSPRNLYLGLPLARQGAGLYVSHDGGATWARALTGLPTAIVVSPADPAVIWVARPGSIAVSADRGVHWSTVLDTGAFRYGGSPATPIVADAADAETAYVGNRLTRSMAALVKTTDGGRHWQALKQGLPAHTYILAMAQHPLDPGQLLVSDVGGGIYRSQDGGASWSLGGYLLTGLQVSSLAATPRGILYATADNNVFRAAAGDATWETVLAGPILPHGGALTIDPTDPRTIYSGIFDSPDVGSGLDLLYKSTDGGATWDDLDVPGVVTSVTDLVVDPHDPRTLYAAALTDASTSGAILKSTDAGATWTLLAGPVGAGELALDASTSPSTVYFANGSLLRSGDGGATWTTLAIEVGGKEVHEITHLALAPGAPRILYVLSEEQGASVVRSSDGGATWAYFSQRRNRSAAPPADSHHPLAVDPTNPRILFAGWSAGVTRSIDGAPWTELDDGLPPSPVETLLLTGGQLLVGTVGAGAFALPLDSLAPSPHLAP